MNDLTLILALYVLAGIGTAAFLFSAALQAGSADAASPGVILFRIGTLTVLWPLTLAVFGLAAVSPMVRHWILNGVDK